VFAYVQDDAKFYVGELDSEFSLATVAKGELLLEVFGDIVHGQMDEGGDIPRLPPWRVGSRLFWSAQRLEIWTRVQYADDQGRPRDFESSTRWNLGGEYGIPVNNRELMAFVELKNIGDEEIRLSTSFLRDVAPESGRSLTAGFRYFF
jgi:iron complex outermembrane receptor protein